MPNIQEIIKKSNIECGDFVQEWKPIIGFKNVINNLYEISNDGEVRNIDTKEIRHKKISTKLYHSYYSVSLKHNDGKLGWVLVHQLVGYFFIPIPNELDEYRGTINLVIDHKDNNGLNNNINNLQWTTRGNNTKLSIVRNDFIHNNGKENNINFLDLHNVCIELANSKPYKNILLDCGFDYNVNNVRFLRNIANKKARINIPDIIDRYNIDIDTLLTANSTRPTPLQYEISSKLQTIRDLILLGKTNSEIVDELWPDLKKSTRKSRIRTVHHIRTGQIYKNII